MDVGDKVEWTARARKEPGIGVRKDNGKPLCGLEGEWRLYPDSIEAIGEVVGRDGDLLYVRWPLGGVRPVNAFWLTAANLESPAGTDSVLASQHPLGVNAPDEE